MFKKCPQVPVLNVLWTERLLICESVCLKSYQYTSWKRSHNNNIIVYRNNLWDNISSSKICYWLKLKKTTSFDHCSVWNNSVWLDCQIVNVHFPAYHWFWCGFSFGLWLGHSDTSIWFDLNDSVVNLAVCFGVRLGFLVEYPVFYYYYFYFYFLKPQHNSTNTMLSQNTCIMERSNHPQVDSIYKLGRLLEAFLGICLYFYL